MTCILNRKNDVQLIFDDSYTLCIGKIDAFEIAFLLVFNNETTLVENTFLYGV